jgi:hypothetical protein
MTFCIFASVVVAPTLRTLQFRSTNKFEIFRLMLKSV